MPIRLKQHLSTDTWTKPVEALNELLSVADVEACFGCWLMVWEHPVDGNLRVTIAKPHKAKVASGWHESRPDEVDEWHYSRAFRREPVEEMAHHICDMWNAETVPDYEPAPD